MSKRVLAMALAILAFFIFVGSPFQHAANAVVGVDDALIAIIIAALAALGITLVTSDAFTSLSDYVGELIEQYAADRNVSPSQLLAGVQTGTTKLGSIVVNNRFVQFIQAFATWIKAKFSLANNSTYRVAEAGLQISSYITYELPVTVYSSSNTLHYFTISANTMPVYCIWRSNGVDAYVLTFSAAPFVASRLDKGNFTYTHTFDSYSSSSYPGLYYRSFAASDLSSLNAGGWYYTTDTDGTILNKIYGESVVAGSADISIITGDIILPADDPGYTEGDGAIIDVNADWGLGYDEVTEGVIPNDFSDSKEGSATITYESEQDAADQVEDTPAQVISQEVNDYQSPGLQSVFPFCIPFDIYAFFECLAAEPEAPSFVWRFYIPRICDEEIEIDLAEFDSAARILRTAELLLFIVGLAFVTREKFLRG